MIQKVSRNELVSFCKSDKNYNQYGLQKTRKDKNNPSNKALNRDKFVKNKKRDEEKNKLSPILALSIGFTGLFYGILRKPNIF